MHEHDPCTFFFYTHNRLTFQKNEQPSFISCIFTKFYIHPSHYYTQSNIICIIFDPNHLFHDKVFFILFWLSKNILTFVYVWVFFWYPFRTFFSLKSLCMIYYTWCNTLLLFSFISIFSDLSQFWTPKWKSYFLE